MVVNANKSWITTAVEEQFFSTKHRTIYNYCISFRVQNVYMYCLCFICKIRFGHRIWQTQKNWIMKACHRWKHASMHWCSNKCNAGLSGDQVALNVHIIFKEAVTLLTKHQKTLTLPLSFPLRGIKNVGEGKKAQAGNDTLRCFTKNRSGRNKMVKNAPSLYNGAQCNFVCCTTPLHLLL